MNKNKKSKGSYMNNKQIKNKLRSINSLLKTANTRKEELFGFRDFVETNENFLTLAIDIQIGLIDSYVKSLNDMSDSLRLLKNGKKEQKLKLQKEYDQVKKCNQNSYTELKNYEKVLNSCCYYNRMYLTHTSSGSCILCNHKSA